VPIPVPTHLERHELRAWADVVDALGHFPIGREHAHYVEILACALADLRRCSRSPVPLHLAGRRDLLRRELTKCGVAPGVVAGLTGGAA
jgi:hypothetical protein